MGGKKSQDWLLESPPPYENHPAPSRAEKMAEEGAVRDGVLPPWNTEISEPQNLRERERIARVWHAVKTGAFVSSHDVPLAFSLLRARISNLEGAERDRLEDEKAEKAERQRLVARPVKKGCINWQKVHPWLDRLYKVSCIVVGFIAAVWGLVGKLSISKETLVSICEIFKGKKNCE